MIRKLTPSRPAEYPTSWYAHSAPLLPPYSALEGEIGRLKEALRSAEEKALAAAAQAEHEKKRAEAMAANLTVARAQAAEEARAAAKAVGETADAEHRIETLRHTRTLLFDELDAAKITATPLSKVSISVMVAMAPFGS